MSKKNIIVINGKHYDAKTGNLVVSHASPTAVKRVSRRRPAASAAAHQPKPSRTLMRQAVKKPVTTHQRPVKAHGHLDIVAKRPLGDVLVKPSVHRLDHQRLQHAKRVNKSQLVSRFSADLFSGGWSSASVTAVTKAAAAPARQAPTPSSKPKTTAELLDYALGQATAHKQAPASPPHKRRGLLNRKSRPAIA